MTKKIIILLFIVFSLVSCVETVVVGTVVSGAFMLSDGNVFDLTEDSRIETAIKKTFKNSSENNEYKNININVFNAKVLLTGYVQNNQYKINAVSQTKSVRPGIEVMDEIIVLNPNYKISGTKDSLIFSRISLQLKGSSGISSGNYEYSVVDGVVFVMGQASDRQELQKVVNIISRIKGVRKVVSYIIIIPKK